MEDDVRYTRRELAAGGALLCGAALLALTRRLLTPAPPPWTTRRVPVNRADEAELRCVPGIGPASAAAIVSARPITDLDQLEPVLGPARLARARPWLELDP